MLLHSRPVDEDAHETFLIGFYSSHQKAQDVIERYKNIDGFRNHPKDFAIEEWEVDVDDFNRQGGDYNGKVFYLAHEYYDGTEYDYVTKIGVYSKRQNAKKALSKYKGLPDFKEHADGFTIDEYDIDEDNWTQGF